MDEPDHRTYRQLTQAWFMPGRLRILEEGLAKLASEFVYRMAELGKRLRLRPRHRRLVSAASDHDDPWSTSGKRGPDAPAYAGAFFWGGGADPDMNKGQKKDATSAVRGFFEYFRSLTNERRKAPKDDLASLLANAEIDGKPISDFDRNSRYILSGDSRPRYDEFVDFGPPARAPRPPRSTRQVTRRSVSRIFGGKREHSLGDAGQVFLQNGYAGLHLSGAGHQERTVLDALLLVRKSRRGNMRQTFHFSRRP
jgi:hypothetical protein